MNSPKKNHLDSARQKSSHQLKNRGLKVNASTIISLNLKSIRIATMALLGGILSLTSCSNDEINQAINMAISVKNKENLPQVCELHNAPFTHALCTVSQKKLTKLDSKLSLKLFWKSGKLSENGAPVDTNQNQRPLYTFTALVNDLPKNTQLNFAANAGMYNGDFSPIGYTVLNGEQILSLNLKSGIGNFHLMPNGVFWWDKSGKVFITESRKMQKLLKNKAASPLYATQSGPMLVIDNKIHPKFNPTSTSKKIRNGVGVCKDGNIKFVSSSELVNFHQFATYFKEDLKCPDALFLDGGIATALYAPDINQKSGKNMGVMVGLVEQTKD